MLVELFLFSHGSRIVDSVRVVHRHHVLDHNIRKPQDTSVVDSVIIGLLGIALLP